MGKKSAKLPVEEVDVSAVKYHQPTTVKAPHLMGLAHKMFVWLIELPILGAIILEVYKRMNNNFNKVLRNTVIPEKPMFRPEFPPQEKEPGVVVLDEDKEPTIRLASALQCLPPYDSSRHWNHDSPPFLYWTIRDYAHAYRSNLTTPSILAERIISAVEKSNNRKPPMSFLVSFNVDDVRKQAAASTQRFSEGNPLSILDGIFMAIKDDTDCFPHSSKGGTTWLHKLRPVKQDAVCVSRLRSCGVIFIGKANMNELGLGTTGNNPNYGTTRNPHSTDRYTGGSSSGPAAIVASGLCPAAVGTDGGGSVRIPSSLCGVVGLKTTFARIDMKGLICGSGTVEVVSPLAATVEDTMLVYAAMGGCSPVDRISLNPSALCLPNLSPSVNLDILRSTRLGKYSEWFHDVYCPDISTKCEDALNLLLESFGCKITEITVPELEEMRTAHLVTIGAESLNGLYPNYEDGTCSKLTLDTRVCLELFRTFSAVDYVSAQRLRRRLMYYHMEIFKKVDIIVTPTTGMTAPKIPLSSLEHGETNYEVTGYLMRFILAGNLLGLPAVTVPVNDRKI
ncbi:uncharacterized protein A4U43_C04F1960 [Asparagus officinalis]|uniref:Amidase domain-containing protein n=1 Tax=Asparagus officinalis TaxID=4686 RepID=A0A5P1F211_ASPOF|nr:uncharacterized protein A4U43_C04F1960 [Asparagus officinalis]